MTSYMEKYELAQQKYLEERQEGEASLDTIFYFLEMGFRAYKESSTQQKEQLEQETILENQMTVGGEEKVFLEFKTIQKRENKIQKRREVRKLQKGGKQNKKGIIERYGGKNCKNKGRIIQRREGKSRSLKKRHQDRKKNLSYKDNG